MTQEQLDKLLKYMDENPKAVDEAWEKAWREYPSPSFLRFVFNRRGFGRTHWLAALWIHAFGAVGVVMAVHGETWALLSLVSVAALWLGTWMNFKGYWR